MNKLRERIKNSQNLKLLVIILVAVVVYSLLNHFGAVRNAFVYTFRILAPIIVAAIIALILNPLVSWLEKRIFKKVKHRRFIRGFCVIVIMFVLFALIVLLLYLLVNQVTVSLRHLISNFNSYLQSFNNMLTDLLGDRGREIQLFGMNMQEVDALTIEQLVDSFFEWFNTNYAGIIGSTLSLGSGVVNVFIIVMLSIYMLMDIEHLKKFGSRFFRSIMKTEKYSRFTQICSSSAKLFIRYFASNLLDSLIIGIACYLFMVIMGLPYSVLIAALVGVTNFVPTFGPLVGALLGGFLILIMNPWGALWFIVYEIASQFVDANILKPKLFGDTTGLRPMWVLAAIVVCGGLFGVFGMLLGVPLFAIVALLINEGIEKRLKRKLAERDSIKSLEE